MESRWIYCTLPDTPTQADIDFGVRTLIEKAKTEFRDLRSLRPILPAQFPDWYIVESGEYRVRYAKQYDIEKGKVCCWVDMILTDAPTITEPSQPR